MMLACDCCPHLTIQDLRDNPFLWEVWQNCPESGCFKYHCEPCRQKARAFRRVYDGQLVLEAERLRRP